MRHVWRKAAGVGVPMVIAVILFLIPSGLLAETNRSELPVPQAPFAGKIGKSFENSAEDFPQPVRAPEGAPNIVLILLDDVGFGQPGTFGGPVPTPQLDSLASQGLIYNRFHSTGICSPTRAALLTGRNHHQTGFGTITELSTGYPGYNSIWGRDVASIAEVLRQNGYNTAAWGKWHNTPDWETTSIGPFDRWPTGLGFEYWYGFQGGETSQWEPQLFRNTTPVEPGKRPEQGYHLTEDLADDAISWIRNQKSINPEKPYFAYFATGAAHAPLHVPKEWIEKFKGKFDQGWDALRIETFERQKKRGIIPKDAKLTPRPEQIPEWNSLSDDAKRLFSKQMEVFAAFLAHTDYHVGRIIEEVKDLPDADNTLIIYVAGDNGPSAEGTPAGTLNDMMALNGIPDTVDAQLPHIDEIGGPEHGNHYAVGWAWAGSSPFQWMKRVPSHFGGTRNGMIISWPRVIKEKGGVRPQFHHVVDIVPTICDAAGVPFPKSVNGETQTPLAGTSMAYTFSDPGAPGKRTVQYFEVGGHRAIYHENWLASAFHGVPWQLRGSAGDFDSDKWELYNIEEDFSQATDLAAEFPEKLAEMKKIFDDEANKFDVYPLDDRFVNRLLNSPRPSVITGKTKFSYSSGTVRIPEGSAPPIYRRSHTITVDLKIPEQGAEGVLIAEGGRSGGYAFFIKDDHLVYEYNFFNKYRYKIRSTEPVPLGDVRAVLRYQQKSTDWGGGGSATLYINGQQAGTGKIEFVVPGRFSATETMDIGMDLGSPVSKDYLEQRPFAFSGSIEKVTIELEQ